MIKNMNCWDFIKCPKEYREYCLAYPNHGKTCWQVTLVSCKNGKELNPREKVQECQQCEFFRILVPEDKIGLFF